MADRQSFRLLAPAQFVAVEAGPAATISAAFMRTEGITTESGMRFYLTDAES